MACRTAEIDQAAFGEHEQLTSVGQGVLIDLGFDFDFFHTFESVQGFDLDLVIKVTNVTNNGLIFHRRQVINGDDVFVARSGDVNV